MLQKFKITAYAFTVFCAVFMTLPVNTSAQNGEEVEETCYDEFNIEIDCADPDALHHGEGDGHANDGVSGGHAQPGAPHGEEVEETCYDESNIEIDCNGHENDAVEYGEEVGYDDDDESENDAGE